MMLIALMVHGEASGIKKELFNDIHGVLVAIC